MSESKPFGQLSNAWPKVRGQPFQSQHELMLTWIEPGVPHRLLTEVREKSNLVTQFSQRPVIARCECGFHLDYVLASSNTDVVQADSPRLGKKYISLRKHSVPATPPLIAL